MGADGMTLDSGSALDTQRDTARAGALSVGQDIYQGDLTGYGYQAQATSFGAQAGLDTAQASQAGTAGMIGAGSSLLNTASQFSTKWANYYTPMSATGTYGGGVPIVGPGGTLGGGI